VPQFFLTTSARALQAEFLDAIAAIECPLAEAIAASTGADSQGELGGEVIAAPSGVARVAAERSPQPESDAKFLHAADLQADDPAVDGAPPRGTGRLIGSRFAAAGVEGADSR
jgi:hypothetical protein